MLTASAFTGPLYQMPLDYSNQRGITRLVLSNFRNYGYLECALTPRPVVLTGMNGAGKTNILEALSLLSPGRGLRGNKLSQMIRTGGEKRAPLADSYSWAVTAQLACYHGQAITLGTALEVLPTGLERRIVKIEGAVAHNQAALTDWISIVWVTPYMGQLFVEPAAARRKFIDRLAYAVDSSYANHLHRYERALKERSFLLRHGQAETSWLEVLETSLAKEAVIIAAARQTLLGNLERSQVFEHSYLFPPFKAHMVGEVETWLEQMPALDVEEKLKIDLATNRRVDAETGGAAVGIHRSDMAVYYYPKELPAEACSTGEQKMLLLSLILAFMRTQRQKSGLSKLVLLLLDDVVTHLDHQHRSILFEEIQALGVQAWLTGTDEAEFQELAGYAQFFQVHHGNLKNGFYSYDNIDA